MIVVERLAQLPHDANTVRSKLRDLPALAGLVPNITGWAAPAPDRFIARIQGRVALVRVRATALVRVAEDPASGAMHLDGTVVRGDVGPQQASKPGLRAPSWGEFHLEWLVRPSRFGSTLQYTLRLAAPASWEGWLLPLIEARLARMEAKLVTWVGPADEIASAVA